MGGGCWGCKPGMSSYAGSCSPGEFRFGLCQHAMVEWADCQTPSGQHPQLPNGTCHPSPAPVLRRFLDLIPGRSGVTRLH